MRSWFPPFFAITASTLLGRLSTRCWNIAADICFHSATRAQEQNIIKPWVGIDCSINIFVSWWVLHVRCVKLFPHHNDVFNHILFVWFIFRLKCWQLSMKKKRKNVNCIIHDFKRQFRCLWKFQLRFVFVTREHLFITYTQVAWLPHFPVSVVLSSLLHFYLHHQGGWR